MNEPCLNPKAEALCAAMFGLLVAYAAGAQAADIAGAVLLAKGAVSAESTDKQVRLIGKESQVFVGDRITTADKSFAVIQFIDGAKVTIRPRSELVIDQYAYTGADDDRSALSLVKGGLRALTGLIGSNNPDAYKVNTPLSVLGIRGTDYDARLCEADCASEEEQYEDAKPAKPASTKSPAGIEGSPPGLYATAYKDRIFLQKDGQFLEIGPGEGGFADEEGLSRLAEVPQFLIQDTAAPRPVDVDESGAGLPGLECRV